MIAKIGKLALAFALIVLVLNPALVMAQSNTNTTNSSAINVPKYEGVEGSIRDYLCTPIEGVASGDELTKSLESCINKLYRFGIAFGGIALVFFVVLAGYFYITGGESGKGRAKLIIQNALAGMFLLLGSYVLLNFINPNLTIFKPIQPPIFDAEDLPTCDEIGFANDNCAIAVNGAETTDGAVADSTGGGSYADCNGGVVPITGIPRVGSGSRICKELLDKMTPLLAQFKSQAPGYSFGISSTIRNGSATSRCHYGNNSKSGNCADTVLRTAAGARVPGNNAAWGTLCRILLGAGLSLANETGSAHQGCRNPQTFKYTNGPHFHVYVPAK